MNSTPLDRSTTPVTVNLHITRRCNYHCRFCYAPFPDVRQQLDLDSWLRLIRVIGEAPPIWSRYKVDKLTFAGGEPTLVLFLPVLLKATHDAGLVSSLVTNGTRLTEDYLSACAQYLDWVSLSIESQIETTNATLGRGHGQHVRTMLDAVECLRAHPHIAIKLNTVVTKLNHHEDLHDLVRAVAPVRWKILQVTLIEGQNDAEFETFAVTAEEFDDFCHRHRDLDPVCERENQIRGSYLMVDPRGRMFGNATGRHVYSDPILEVGLEAAVGQVGWSPSAFLARGGNYDWRRQAHTKPCRTRPAISERSDGTHFDPQSKGRST